MARYFFDFYDGEVTRDLIGVECDGHEAVRHAAMRALPEIASEFIPRDGNTQAYTVAVRNRRNLTVYTATLTFSGTWMGEDAPGAADAPRADP